MSNKKRGVYFIPKDEVYEKLQKVSKKTGISRTEILSRLVLIADKNPKILYNE